MKISRRSMLATLLGAIATLPFVEAENISDLFSQAPTDYYRIEWPMVRRDWSHGITTADWQPRSFPYPLTGNWEYKAK
jgi:hypothetical protein